jgi:glycerophosphoryl diester phosphodiesterase
VKGKNDLIIIAHRGASKLVKFENTLEAFQKAIDIGADMMEFDIRRTKDNMYISYHDEKIGGVKLSTLTYEEILKISMKKGFKVPLVEEILKMSAKKICLDIELKEEGYEEEIIKLVTKYLGYDEFVIKSFNDSSVKIIKEIDSNITTGLLLGIGKCKNIVRTRISELFPEFRIIKSKVDFVSPNYRLLKCFFQLRMQILNKDIYIWTVNDRERMKKLMNKKVQAIITDRPDIALKLIKK